MAGLEECTQREVIQCNHPILGAAREGQKHVLLDVDISPPNPPLKMNILLLLQVKNYQLVIEIIHNFIQSCFEDTERITQKYIILKCNLFYIFNLNIL